MVSLATALQTARQSLLNSGVETSLISRNISSSSQSGYARRVADYTTGENAATVTVRRIAEDAMRTAALAASSDAAASETRRNALDRLDVLIGTQSGESTLPGLLGALQTSMTTYANAPGQGALGEAVVVAADKVATRLNDLAASVTELRAQADRDIAASVTTINALLQRFKSANDSVVAGTTLGRDVADAQEERDAILGDLAREIGITVKPHRDGGLSIYADGGLTLFEREPRLVSFTASGTPGAGVAGAAVTIDGVDATSATSMMKVTTGRLAALTALRDETGLALQGQLDETARVLLDATSAGGPPALFALGGAVGSAAWRIEVNAAVDPLQGGDVTLLRDGTMNPAGLSGFSGRLVLLAGGFDADATFSAQGAVPDAGSLNEFAAGAYGWFAAQRKDAADSAARDAAVRDRTLESLSNAVGVNVDEEMARLLEVERAYQASAKILTAVDAMFGSLFEAVR